MGAKCVHCGDDCGRKPILLDEQPFCCHGCKTVYQILNENKLEKYYDIQPMPGIKIEQQEFGDKYAYLDLDEIKEKLVSFSDGGISKIELFIPHYPLRFLHLAARKPLHAATAESSSVPCGLPRKRGLASHFRESEISLRTGSGVAGFNSLHTRITLDKLEVAKRQEEKRPQPYCCKSGLPVSVC